LLFWCIDINPSPDKYHPPTLFKPDNTTSTFAVFCTGDKTYSFGAGRDAFKKVILDKKRVVSDFIAPGPGTYDPLHPIGEDALKFKLKAKLYYGEADQIARKRDVPPPGHYED